MVEMHDATDEFARGENEPQSDDLAFLRTEALSFAVQQGIRQPSEALNAAKMYFEWMRGNALPIQGE